MPSVSATTVAGAVYGSEKRVVSEWVKRAKDVLRDTGAQDVSSTGEASADYAASDKPRPRAKPGRETGTERPRTKTGGGGYEV